MVFLQCDMDAEIGPWTDINDCKPRNHHYQAFMF